jgi:hypothetical protein
MVPMKKLIWLVLIGGAAVVLLALQGVINVPGITPAPTTPKSGAESLKPPTEDKKDAPPPPATAPKKSEGGQSEARKLEPTGGNTPASKPSSLYPPIKPEDVARARGLYEKGDLSGVGRALEGCERAEVADAASTQAARSLVRKARLLVALTRTIAKSPLATATKLERVSLDSGGTVIGNVLEKGEQLVIQLPGSVETTVAKDSVVERTPVKRDVLDEKLRAKLKDRAAKVEADDTIGNYRLGHYCWQYGMLVDAMPYLDRSVEGADSPAIARVFGGKEADSLIDQWCDLTGRPRPAAPEAKPGSSGNANGTKTPPPPPVAVSGSDADILTAARKRYDEGVEKYKSSFGDSASATRSLKDARAAFIAARDVLAKLGESNDPKVEELQTQIARLLYDCNKRSAIN